jgi:hypothetical protein
MPTAEQQLRTIRKVLPQQFQDRFDRLWSKQRRELIRIVGSPPDVSKITKAQWKKWQEERAAALLALMLGYTIIQIRQALEQLQTMDIPRIDRQTTLNAIERRIIASTRDRARFASEVIGTTTRTRLESGSFAEDVLNESRSRMIVATEMTAARSAVTVGMFTELRRIGVECDLVWRLRPCMHCEVCPLLADTSYDYWSRFFPKGPPVHPHCCCQLELLFGSRASLLKAKRIKSGPPVRSVRMAVQRSGFKAK